MSSRLAVVVGVGSEIGTAAARRLAAEGLDLVVTDRRADVASTLARELEHDSTSVTAVAAQPDTEAGAAAVADVVRASGQLLHTLFHAGVAMDH